MKSAPHPCRWRYAITFGVLGMVVLWMIWRPANLLSRLAMTWVAMDLLMLCGAYAANWPHVFGKGLSPILGTGLKILCGPYLIFTRLVWIIQNRLSRGALWSEISPTMFVGRYGPPRDWPSAANVIVDLTAEFPRLRSPGDGFDMIIAPTLDGCVPGIATLDEVMAAITKRDDAVVHIMCANGAGRSVTLAGAILLRTRQFAGAPEALARLRFARPQIAPNADQRAFLDRLTVEKRINSRRSR